ncbi:MAG: ATP-binding cassette domain-containing protein [Candidatus Latescibacterota bacterium]|nr:ATP-binding cassette domain-containing protein [Candidatus Latescibacterota bacterium]
MTVDPTAGGEANRPASGANARAVFELRNVTVAYDEVPAIERVSLRIEEGEKVVLIGPSGAGKSTLLRHLYELSGEQGALIHQDYSLIPQLSVFHNVYAGRLDQHTAWRNFRTLLRPALRDMHAVQPILEALDLQDKTHERVQALSGGQQQRVAVGRAVYRDGQVLLGDEPVSAIDPHQAGRVLELIKGSAATVVLAMHDVQLALEHFSRVVALRDGQITFDLPAAQVDRNMLSHLYRAEG